MGDFGIEPVTGSPPSKDHGIQPIPEEGEVQSVEDERDLDPTLLGKSIFFLTHLADVGTRTMRREGAEKLIELQQTRLAKWASSIGSGALEFLDRTQSSMIAGQRILVRAAKGKSTADLITPMEIIGNWDFRDPELEEFGRVTLNKENRPGQRELLKEIIGEEKLKNMQETPFELFGLPMKFDSPTQILNSLLYKEYVIPETADSQVIINNEQITRFTMNLWNDAFLPLGLMGDGARGVRGIRSLQGAEKAEEVAASIEKVANSVPKSAVRAVDKAARTVPFDLENIPIEQVSKAVDTVMDFRSHSPVQLWKSLDAGIAALDPESPKDVLKFKSLIDQIADGKSAFGIESGISFPEGLDYGLSSHEFTDIVDRISAFGERTGLEDLGNLRRFRLSDSLAGASITTRPVAIFPDGRVLYHSTPKAEDFTPLKNKNMRLIYRLMTGKSFDEMPAEGVGLITSRIIKDPDRATPRLMLKLRLPNWTGDNGIRERVVDQFQETLGMIDASSRASKYDISRAIADARRVAKDKAELAVYKAYGIKPNPADLQTVGENKAIINAGRARVNRMTSADQINVQRKIMSRAEKAATKAENEVVDAMGKDTFDLGVQVDVGVPGKSNKRKVVDITRGDITSMITKEGRDLRTIINSKAPLRGTRVVEDKITGEIKFFSRKSTGPAKTLLRPREGDLAAGRASAAQRPLLGNVVNEEQGVRGSVDDAMNELLDTKPSKTQEIFEHETPLVKNSGGGVPPKPPYPTDLPLDPTPVDGPKRVRDMTIFGWVRDPERVLHGTGIFEELLAAEHGLYRTQEALASVINSRLGWLKIGSASSRRIGRIMAGKATDIDGKVIQLTDKEDEAMRFIKTIMDHMMEQGGHSKSDNIKDYFGVLMSTTHGPKPKISPQLLDTPVNGNAFYSHLLPEVKGAPRDVSYDIAETFRTFARQASSDIHMKPAFKRAKEIADTINLPKQKRRYLNFMIDRMQGKPTRLGRIIDEGIANALEQTHLHHLFRPIQHQGGLKFVLGRSNYANPASRFSLGLTRQLYRGLLGGNVGFMFKNLAQNINTMAEVGPLHTLRGAAKLATPEGFKLARSQKLVRDFNAVFEEEGVATGLAKSIDDFIFAPVRYSEFINRGVAFHAGISAEASRLGKPVRELLENPETALHLFSAGHTVAQRTQFIYGTLGRSPVFGTGFGRVVGQFMTYPIKQTEFLAEQGYRNRTALTRMIGLTGYFSRLISEAGVDPTGFVGFGFIPQGIEPGIPIVLPAGLQGMYHLMRFSNAMATGDLTEQERWSQRMFSDALHLVPTGLQAEKFAHAADRYQTLSITNDTQDLIRPLSTREQVIMWSGLPTIESRLSRDLASDMMQTQKLEQFQRRHLIHNMLNYFEDHQEKVRNGEATDLTSDSYWNKMISQARAWGLPITSEQVNAAAKRRELSSYLRRMDNNKRLAVEFWNRYILEIPGEAERLGLQPIQMPKGTQQ